LMIADDRMHVSITNYTYTCMYIHKSRRWETRKETNNVVSYIYLVILLTSTSVAVYILLYDTCIS